MKKFVFALTLLLCQIPYAQNNTVKLDYYEPHDPLDDLKSLDPYFEGRKMIGLGESTHGTHEFFRMRHRLIKYLVESHEFNTVFMEADFAACLPINEFITKGKGTSTDAVDALGLWPWITQEMVDLVEWLRSYNSMHPTNQVSFIGADVQKINETIVELEEILEKYDIKGRNGEIIENNDFYRMNKKEQLELRAKELSTYESIDASDFTVEDEYLYTWLFRHLNQILSEKTVKKSLQSSYRDKMMGENILQHLKDRPSIKGVYWAHNGHIANFLKNEKGVAGGHLKDQLKDQYFILGFDFDYGSFNARIKPQVHNDSYNKWEMAKVEVEESPYGSLAANYRKIKHPIIFIPFAHLPPEEEVYVNSIGAVYWTNKKGEASEYLRKNHYGRDAFDALILIKESTPTTLITQ